MKIISILFAVATVTSVLAAAPLHVAAQTSGDPTSASQKTQRKEARKAARASKNSELQSLERNGYQPGGADQKNYPKDIQNAEAKVDPQKAMKSAPASAP